MCHFILNSYTNSAHIMYNLKFSSTHMNHFLNMLISNCLVITLG